MRTEIIVVLFILSPVFALADNVVHPGTPTLDRPTLTTLGVQLPITGDDNFNASVTVRYRKTGTGNWRQALPLFRVHPENTALWTVPTQFAGSVFDLRPNMSYDIELHLTDPDGPVDQIFTLTATTRPVPADPLNPRMVNVGDINGLNSALQGAQPGDIITLADGLYNVGTIFFFASGTAQNPIVVRGASEEGTVLDGGNCDSCNVLEVYGSYVHIERLTLQNAQRALRFQTAGATGNVVRRVHIKNTTTAIFDRPNQTDFYICDNQAEGRLTWPLTYGSDGGAHGSDDGLVVAGSGHVVCHNRISGYADAMQTNQNGSRANDFYGNEVLYTYDDGIELDSSEGNVRCFRNRFTNTFDTISLQPILGGPAYVLRNVVVNVAGEQMKFHSLGTTPQQETNGTLAYHNTFVSPARDLYMNTPISPHHFRIENNLFVGPAQLPGYAVEWGGPIDDGLFDYNGYFSDGWFVFNFLGLGYRNFPNFAAAQNGGLETHGRLLSQPIFASGLIAPPSYTSFMAPQDVTLSSASNGLDRGLVLPNVNDGFTGAAPDLGAVESGCPTPIYGPRPAGIDESNETFGCDPSNAPPPPGGTATFIKTDTTTAGSWKGVYGADGFNVVNDTVNYPSYVAVTSSALAHTWIASTTDPRALQKASSSDRIAATWYSWGPLTIDLRFTDNAIHQVALYLLNWDNLSGLVERVDILDANSALLDTQTVSNFAGGQYLVWNLSGHVTIRVVNRNASSFVFVSGLFFGWSGGAPFTPIRIHCGGPQLTDASGNVWLPDNAQNRNVTNATIANTSTPALYQTEAWSNSLLQYQFTVPNGPFTVKLHFAEFYRDRPGQRTFNIIVNGTTYFSNFDILAAVATNTAYSVSIPVMVSNGQIAIQLVPVSGPAKIDAIEIY
jgi:Malectin domain/Chondroitinase B